MRRSSPLVALLVAIAFAVVMKWPATSAAPADAPQTRPSAAPPATAPSLAVQRMEAADEAFRLAHMMYERGLSNMDDVALWSRRRAEAARDPSVPQDVRSSVLTDHLKRMVDLEHLAEARRQAGMAQSVEVAAARYFRLEAEQWVEDAGRK